MEPRASQANEGATPICRVMPSATVQRKGDVVAFNAKRAARAEAARAQKMALLDHALATRNARSTLQHHALIERELEADAQRFRALSAPSVSERGGPETESAPETASPSTEGAVSDTPAQVQALEPTEIEDVDQEAPHQQGHDPDSVRQLRREVAISFSNTIRLIYGASRRFDDTSAKLQSEVDQLRSQMSSLQCTVKGVSEENARLREVIACKTEEFECMREQIAQRIIAQYQPDRRLETFYARVADAVECFQEPSLDDL